MQVHIISMLSKGYSVCVVAVETLHHDTRTTPFKLVEGMVVVFGPGYAGSGKWCGTGVISPPDSGNVLCNFEDYHSDAMKFKVEKGTGVKVALRNLATGKFCKWLLDKVWCSATVMGEKEEVTIVDNLDSPILDALGDGRIAVRATQPNTSPVSPEYSDVLF